jgi:hypothetical protein
MICGSFEELVFENTATEQGEGDSFIMSVKRGIEKSIEKDVANTDLVFSGDKIC